MASSTPIPAAITAGLLGSVFTSHVSSHPDYSHWAKKKSHSYFSQLTFSTQFRLFSLRARYFPKNAKLPILQKGKSQNSPSPWRDSWLYGQGIALSQSPKSQTVQFNEHKQKDRTQFWFRLFCFAPLNYKLITSSPPVQCMQASKQTPGGGGGSFLLAEEVTNSRCLWRFPVGAGGFLRRILAGVRWDRLIIRRRRVGRCYFIGRVNRTGGERADGVGLVRVKIPAELAENGGVGRVGVMRSESPGRVAGELSGSRRIR